MSGFTSDTGSDINSDHSEGEEEKEAGLHRTLSSQTTIGGKATSRLSQLKNLTLIDCDIGGLHKLLDTVGLSGRLEQLIIIYNETLES